MASACHPSLKPHRRRNPLTGEWVLVSPHRTKRPWQGQAEGASSATQRYDKDCYLCPGNRRANGADNPDYSSVYVFDNDFSALHSETDPNDSSQEATLDPLFTQESENGCCRVICYSPDHAKSLARLSDDERVHVVKCWQTQMGELSESYTWVQ
ncbi:galactose-1-phosphate uridylyltransferase, partial [Alteromonas oceanisediminis]|uniref:galactose-1-phosphate uridylyltransferase n=1 Tax=Alteromonas oceanisediminis TaxID=2836180 RepID=UPI0020239276